MTFNVSKEATQNAQKNYIVCEHFCWEPLALEKQKNGSFDVDVELLGNDDNLKKYHYRYLLVLEDEHEIYVMIEQQIHMLLPFWW